MNSPFYSSAQSATVIASLESDFLGEDLFPECDVVNFTITVENVSSGTVTVDVRYGFPNFNPPEFDIVDAGGFSGPTVSGQNYLIYELQDVVLEPDEVEEFTFSAQAGAGVGDDPRTIELAVVDQSNNLLAGDQNTEVTAWASKEIASSGSVNISSLIEPLHGPFELPPHPQSLSRDDFIVLEGNLIIDVPYGFGYSALPNNITRFHFKQGSSIVVEDELTLDHVLLSSCGQLWDGIVVEPGGKLVMENCRIENALKAVTVKPGGEVFFRNNTFVDNHENIHFVDDGNSSTSQATLTGFSGNVFTMDQGLLASGPPFGVYSVGKAEYGVKIDKAGDYDLGTGNGGVNRFDDLIYGIISRNADLRVAEARFENIGLENPQGEPFPVIGGSGIQFDGDGNRQLIVEKDGLFSNYGTEFTNCLAPAIFSWRAANLEVREASISNCPVGIEARRTSTTNLENNFMEEVETGIDYHTPPGFYPPLTRIEDNRIYASDFGIRLQTERGLNYILDNFMQMDGDEAEALKIDGYGNSSGVFGVAYNTVYLQNGQYGFNINHQGTAAVQRNTVNVTSSTEEVYDGMRLINQSLLYTFCNEVTSLSLGLDGTGISIKAPHSARLECNEMDGPRVGLLFGDLSPARMRGNSFGEHFYGLQLNDPLGTSETVIGEQLLHGNLWTGDYSGQGYGAVHYGISEVEIEASSFEVNNTSQQNPENETPNCSGCQWFVNNPNPVYVCNPTTQCGGQIGDPDPNNDRDILQMSFFEEIARDSFTAAYHPDGFRWKAQRRLYRHLQERDTTDWVGTVFDTFYVNETAGRVAEYAGMEKRLLQVFTQTSDAPTLIEPRVELLESLWDSLSVIDTLLESPGADTTTLLANRDSVRADIELQVAYLSQQSALAHELVLDSLNALSDEVTALVADSTWHSNEKTVWSALVELAALDTFDIPSSTRTALEAVAGQCPQAGGDAVYWARALLGEGDYDDETLCAQAQSNQGERAFAGPDGEKAFDLFPNPARDQLTLWIRDAAIQQGEWQLLDATGRLQRQWPLGEGALERIDVQDLPAGLYFISLQDGGSGERHTRQVLIVR